MFIIFCTFFSYTKIVNKGMTKAEMILKVIHLFYISFQQRPVIHTIKSECVREVPCLHSK